MLIVLLGFITSGQSFADEYTGVYIGCLAKKYCEVSDRTDMDIVFVNQLNLVTNDTTIKKYCDKMVFSLISSDSEYRDMRLDEIKYEFSPGSSCLQPIMEEIRSKY
jgi:hypothetical protein